MRPLIYINKKEDFLEYGTLAVERMNSDYKSLGNELITEFKYNIDSFFSIRIKLNELDQPEYIYIRTTKDSKFQKVTKEKQEYVLKSHLVRAIVTYDDIVGLANNTIMYEDIKKFDLKAQIFNDKLTTKVFMDEFTLYDYEDMVFFKINNQSIMYHIDRTKMPCLFLDGSKTSPTEIIDNYYIYDVKINDVDLRIGIIHPRNFREHYLFKQTPKTHRLTLTNDRMITDSYGLHYVFINGLMQINKEKYSLLNYLSDTTDEEYKQFFFNSARDRNLYTDISISFEPPKHHTLSIWDLKNDLLVYGHVDASIELNKNYVEELVLEVVRPIDQFSRPINKNYKFKIPVLNLMNFIKNKDRKYSILDYGCFYVDSKEEPLTTIPITKEESYYRTGSNNEYFVSVSKLFIEKILFGTYQSLIPMLHKLDDGFFMLPNNKFKEIDYVNKTFSFFNALKSEVLSFDEVTKTNNLIVKSDRIISPDGVSEIFGIKLVSSLQKIGYQRVTPDIIDDYLLQMKHIEPKDYLMSSIYRDTDEFAYNIKLTFMDREFLFVYNRKKKYLYFLDITAQDASKITIDDIDSHLMYFGDIDYQTLIKFLINNSIADTIVKNNGFIATVTNDLDVYFYNRTFSYLSGKNMVKEIDYSKESIVGTITRNSDLKGLIKMDELALQEIYSGIFSKPNVYVTNIKVDTDNSVLVVSIKEDDLEKEYTLSVTNEGTYKYEDVRENQKQDTHVGLNNLENMWGQYYVDKTPSDNYIAFDSNIINYMITEGQVSVDNQITYVLGGKTFLINSKKQLVEYSPQEITSNSENIYITKSIWFGKELNQFYQKSISNKFTDFDKENDHIILAEVYEDDNIVATSLNEVNTKNIVLSKGVRDEN